MTKGGGSFAAGMSNSGPKGKSKGSKGGAAAGGGGGKGSGKAGGSGGDNNFTINMLTQIEHLNRNFPKKSKSDIMNIFDPNVDVFALE